MPRFAVALTLLFLGCSSYGHTPPPAPAPAATAPNGWTSLFDGRTTAGWRGYRMDSLPSGWQVVDGALTRVAEGGDIITTGSYANFELTLDWKISAGGNSFMGGSGTVVEYDASLQRALVITNQDRKSVV